MRRRNEHQVARRPRVERAVRENAGHAELRHLGDVLPSDQLPFIGQNRIDPGVVRAVADRVVIKIRHRLMQIVKYLRLPIKISVQDVARELQRQTHRIAIVVVRDVMSPVN